MEAMSHLSRPADDDLQQMMLLDGFVVRLVDVFHNNMIPGSSFASKVYPYS